MESRSLATPPELPSCPWPPQAPTMNEGNDWNPARAADEGIHVATIIDILRAVWDMIYDAGFYVIFGMVAAGLVHLFVSREWIVRHLGGRGFGSVVKAALLGGAAAALQLQRTAGGVRPAGARAPAAGPRSPSSSRRPRPASTASPSPGPCWGRSWPSSGRWPPSPRPWSPGLSRRSATATSRRRSSRARPARSATPTTASTSPGPAGGAASGRSCSTTWATTWGRRWRRGSSWAASSGPWCPTDFFVNDLQSPWQQMLLMLAIGLPLYICATASTPLALALVAKGLHPGAALVLLLVGPATNITTMLMVARMLGKLSAVLYVGTIAVMSLVCGAVLDLALGALNVNVSAAVKDGEFLPRWLLWAGAIVLAAFLAMALGRWAYRKLWTRVPSTCCAGGACGEAAHAAHGEHDACEADAAVHGSESIRGCGRRRCGCELRARPRLTMPASESPKSPVAAQASGSIDCCHRSGGLAVSMSGRRTARRRGRWAAAGLVLAAAALWPCAAWAQPDEPQIMAPAGPPAQPGYVPAIWSIAPFVLLLLAIAILPLIKRCHRFWDSNRNKLLVAILLSVPVSPLLLLRAPGDERAGGRQSGTPGGRRRGPAARPVGLGHRGVRPVHHPPLRPVHDQRRHPPARRPARAAGRQHGDPGGRRHPGQPHRDDRRRHAPHSPCPPRQRPPASRPAHGHLLHLHRLQHRRMPAADRRPAAVPRVPLRRAVPVDDQPGGAVGRLHRPPPADLLHVGYGGVPERVARRPHRHGGGGGGAEGPRLDQPGLAGGRGAGGGGAGARAGAAAVSVDHGAAVPARGRHPGPGRR